MQLENHWLELHNVAATFEKKNKIILLRNNNRFILKVLLGIENINRKNNGQPYLMKSESNTIQYFRIDAVGAEKTNTIHVLPNSLGRSGVISALANSGTHLNGRICFPTMLTHQIQECVINKTQFYDIALLFIEYYEKISDYKEQI